MPKTKLEKNLGIGREKVKGRCKIIKTISKIKIDGIVEMNIEIKGNSTKLNERMTIEQLKKELSKTDKVILNFNARCSYGFAEDFMSFLKNKSSKKGEY